MSWDPFSEENNGLYKWLKDVAAYWGSPRGQYEAAAIIDKISLGLVSHSEKMEQMDEGLKRYGLTWDDIQYASNTLAWNSAGSYVSGFNYISSNIGKLYR